MGSTCICRVLAGSFCQYEFPPPSEARPNIPIYNCETSVLVKAAQVELEQIIITNIRVILNMLILFIKFFPLNQKADSLQNHAWDKTLLLCRCVHDPLETKGFVFWQGICDSPSCRAPEFSAVHAENVRPNNTKKQKGPVQFHHWMYQWPYGSDLQSRRQPSLTPGFSYHRAWWCLYGHSNFGNSLLLRRMNAGTLSMVSRTDPSRSKR